MDYLTKNMPNGILYSVVQSYKSIELTAEENSVCVIYRLDTYYKNTNHLLWEHKYIITDENDDASNEVIRRETFLSNTRTGDSFDDSYWSTNQDFPTVEMSMPANADTGFEHGEFLTNTAFVGYRFTWKNSVDGKTVKLCFQSRFGRNTPPRGEDYVDPDYETAIPVNDSYSVIQGEQLSFSKNDIVANDLAGESQIANVEIRQTVNCQLQRTGDSFVLTPDADVRYGNDNYPYFTYKLVDKNGIFSRKTGLVSVSIEMLSEVKAIAGTTSEIQELTKTYTPPTLADIFKTWGRFNNANYFPSGTTPTGEAAAWEMISSNQFRCTVNSSTLTGFISPEVFSNYEHTATFSSTAGDDDVIGLIIAFERIGSSNYTLMACRESGGITSYTSAKGFSLVLVVNNTFTPIKVASGTNCWVGSAISGVSRANWNTSSPTRVYVKRAGDIITVKSSPFKSVDIDAGETITIDINDYPSLAWVSGEHSYGYCCYSQQYSSFTDVEFRGSTEVDTDRLYDILAGNVYEYVNGTWSVTGKIWDVLGYPRYLTDSRTGTRYLIENGSVTKVG